jgi:hypothetical protein
VLQLIEQLTNTSAPGDASMSSHTSHVSTSPSDLPGVAAFPFALHPDNRFCASACVLVSVRRHSVVIVNQHPVEAVHQPHEDTCWLERTALRQAARVLLHYTTSQHWLPTMNSVATLMTSHLHYTSSQHCFQRKSNGPPPSCTSGWSQQSTSCLGGNAQHW